MQVSTIDISFTTNVDVLFAPMGCHQHVINTSFSLVGYCHHVFYILLHPSLEPTGRSVICMSFAPLPTCHLHPYRHVICTLTDMSFAPLPTCHLHLYRHVICTLTDMSFAPLPTCHLHPYRHVICTLTDMSFAPLLTCHLHPY